MRRLRDLIRGVPLRSHRGDLERPVSGVAHDSRRVRPGDCFVAIRGFKSDGNRHISQALEKGAAAVVSTGLPMEKDPAVPWLQVENDRQALSRLSANFYGLTEMNMTVIGVTGTNGKTTVASLLQAIIQQGEECGMVGTLGKAVDGEKEKTSLTTPESVEIAEFMHRLSTRGCRYLVMEVSSVALELDRVASVPFTQAVFTNFSGDHLDFHGDLESYFQAKRKLFQALLSEGTAVVNLDDPRGKKLAGELQGRVITYGFDPGADVHPLDHFLDLSGIRARIHTPAGILHLQSPLLGRTNLSNLLAAVASAVDLSLPRSQVEQGVAALAPPRGRLDLIHNGRYRVLLDFAHTDAALEATLRSLVEIKGKGRLVLVFGAGGDRDRTKRPRMGREASRYADHVILTNDNPRSEDPETIAREVAEGFSPGFSGYELELDRRRAIEKALDRARPGDIVLIAGKGHEDYQIFGNHTIHFDDARVVREYLEGESG